MSSPGEPRFSSVSRASPSEDLTAARELARAQTAFALSLLDEGPRDQNVVIGAYGLHALLMMLALAGDETTERSTYAMLGLDGSREDLQRASNTLDRVLETRGSVEPMEGEPIPFVLHGERLLFVSPDLRVRDALLEDLARWHGTGAHAIDLASDEGVEAVNAWTDQHTDGAVPTLLARPFPPSVRALWIDATHFSAMWASPFRRDATADRPFRTPHGDVLVPTMRGNVGRGFAEGEGWRGAQLPYGGGDVAMWLVVPNDWESFRLDLVTLDALEERAHADESVEVVVDLPRLSIGGGRELLATLVARGLPAAGPWSRLSDEPTFVESLQQHTRLVVDELGTRATSVTFATASGISVPRVESLVVDRPFYVILRDRPTGATLFVGRVVDPS